METAVAVPSRPFHQWSLERFFFMAALLTVAALRTSRSGLRTAEAPVVVRSKRLAAGVHEIWETAMRTGLVSSETKTAEELVREAAVGSRVWERATFVKATPESSMGAEAELE